MPVWYNLHVNIDILTLFPQMFGGPFDYSIVKRAQEKGDLRVRIHDLREWATDRYKSVDDRPYGGGAGMVMRVDIMDKAISDLKSQIADGASAKVVLLDAGGEKFSQARAEEFSRSEHLILICGHYEGVDHRVHEHLADAVISIGDYVLSGGELPAMVIVDTVARLLPGVLGNPQSLTEESHSEGLKSEYPQYTRPEDYKGWRVPSDLLSGDPKKIIAWRRDQADVSR